MLVETNTCKLKIFFNLSPIGINDSLQTPSEGLARFANVVLAHPPPLLVDGVLQSLNITVAGLACFTFNVPPDTIVQRVQIRTLWWPESLWPECHAVGLPFLDNFGSVRRCTILLKDVGGLASLLRDLEDLWEDLGLQDIQVVNGRQSVACLKPNWWHFFPCGGHDTQHHH